MSVHLSFAAMLDSVVATVLEGGGFRRQGECFVSDEGPNLLVIEPQKSVKSTADKILFTFNLKVISARLAGLVDGCQPVRATCPVPHWRRRLGGLLPKLSDYWWSFTSGVADDAIATLVDLGIPAIKSVGTDESLRDFWLTGQAPGLSELQRVVYLSTLLAVLGPRDQLASYTELLDTIAPTDPTRERVERHLRLLSSLT